MARRPSHCPSYQISIKPSPSSLPLGLKFCLLKMIDRYKRSIASDWWNGNRPPWDRRRRRRRVAKNETTRRGDFSKAKKKKKRKEKRTRKPKGKKEPTLADLLRKIETEAGRRMGVGVRDVQPEDRPVRFDRIHPVNQFRRSLR